MQINKSAAGHYHEELASPDILEALLNSVLRNSGSIAALFDDAGRPKYCSNGLQDIIGCIFDESDEPYLARLLGLTSMAEVYAAVEQSPDSVITLSQLSSAQKDKGARAINIRLECICVNQFNYLSVGIKDITQEAERQNRLLQLSRMKDVVLDINHKLSEEIRYESFFEYLLSRVGEVMPYADLGCILLFAEDDEETLISAASFGYREEEIRQFRLKIKDSFFTRVTGGVYERAIIINGVHTMAQKGTAVVKSNEEHLIVQSSVSGPIMKDGQLFGFINIDSYRNNVYTEDDVEIMEYLRTQVGIALSRWEIVQKNAYLSKYDQLTGLLNRWYLNCLIDDSFENWKRCRDLVTFAVMDLNDLKRVNDQLGHHQGDAYITTFSSALKQAFRSSDHLFRLGGDEFAGIFFDITEEQLAEKLEKLNAVLSESEIQRDVAGLKLGFGFGIVKLEETCRGIHDLLKIADSRMYTHKAEMKATWHTRQPTPRRAEV